MHQTELDSLTIKAFESRYGIARSNVNNRLNGLKQKGYDLEPEKQEGKNIYNADQIALMDRLDAHLKAGNPIATFPAATGQEERSVSQDRLRSSYRTQDSFSEMAVSQDKPKLSHKTQDNAQDMNRFSGMIIAIADKVADILSLRQPAPLPASTDPLANLKALQNACDHGWLLSSSQLAPLVGLKNLHGKAFERFGFKFVKVGKNGAESAWKVEKQAP